MGAHDPAATELVGGALPVGLTEAEAAEHLLRLGFGTGVAEGVELGLGFKILRVVNGIVLLVFAKNFFQFIENAGPTAGDLERGLIAQRLALLGEKADGGPFVAHDLALVLFVVAEDHVEQRRFAGAVGAHQGNALAVVDGHRGILEEGAPAYGFGEVFDGEHLLRLGEGGKVRQGAWISGKSSGGRRRSLVDERAGWPSQAGAIPPILQMPSMSGQGLVSGLMEILIHDSLFGEPSERIGIIPVCVSMLKLESSDAGRPVWWRQRLPKLRVNRADALAAIAFKLTPNGAPDGENRQHRTVDEELKSGAASVGAFQDGRAGCYPDLLLRQLPLRQELGVGAASLCGSFSLAFRGFLGIALREVVGFADVVAEVVEFEVAASKYSCSFHGPLRTMEQGRERNRGSRCSRLYLPP